MTNSQYPRRNLPRYQSARQTLIRKTKQTFTHQDFMSFMEPFYELLRKKHYEEFKKIPEPKNFDLKKEAYTKWASCLNEKLLSSYQFDNSVEIPNRSYDTPLEVWKPIKSSDYIPPFYEKNGILESYRPPLFKSTLREYHGQIEKNNRRRALILSIIPERAKLSGYFCTLDLISEKLQDMQRKKNAYKKKLRPSELDYEVIREYLDRMYEFFEVFGHPDQFTGGELLYPDIFFDASDKERDISLQYFR